MAEYITIEGAREHNLRNIDVRIPRNSLTVVTGLSGSGKSSLAFDTLYAEGQRRYVESLSAYARQFLGQLQKPDLDSIDGLSPAIAIEQRTTSNNPRSIVATSTEIHDYLRLLFGSIAVPHCPKCGRPVRNQNAEEIVNTMLRLPEKTKLTLLAPVVRGRKGAQTDVLDELRQAGFARVRLDGQVYGIEDVPAIDKKRNHDLEAVVDRVVVAPSARTRLTDSVELALKRGNGLLYAIVSQPGADKDDERIYSEKNA
ncbi:MAG: excinuclease ABC subunit A, partial [Kiritimatiellae bacterium]|nr:excinuclease ABC subunit A [Kiritimatiellia bacterium]